MVAKWDTHLRFRPRDEKKIIGGNRNIGTQPVIFDIAYTPYKLKKNATKRGIAKHKKERKFYDMSGADNIYKYITTEGKMYGEESKKFTMLEYLQKSTGVFNQDGMLSKEQVKEMRKRAQTGEKNLWHGFISFNKENSEKIDHPEKCIALVKQTFWKFFKDAGFDKDNNKRNPKRKYKTNDKNLKRKRAISSRKVKGIMDGLFSSVAELFAPETETYRNRLSEIEEEMQEKYEDENCPQEETKQIHSKWNWSK